jgi:hypothetical protein
MRTQAGNGECPLRFGIMGGDKELSIGGLLCGWDISHKRSTLADRETLLGPVRVGLRRLRTHDRFGGVNFVSRHASYRPRKVALTAGAKDVCEAVPKEHAAGADPGLRLRTRSTRDRSTRAAGEGRETSATALGVTSAPARSALFLHGFCYIVSLRPAAPSDGVKTLRYERA